MTQPSCGAHTYHALRSERPFGRVRIHRAQRAELHQRLQLSLAEAGFARQMRQRELPLRLDPDGVDERLHVFNSRSKCPRGLNVEPSASSLNSSRSRCDSTVGTAISTMA